MYCTTARAPKSKDGKYDRYHYYYYFYYVRVTRNVCASADVPLTRESSAFGLIFFGTIISPPPYFYGAKSYYRELKWRHHNELLLLINLFKNVDRVLYGVNYIVRSVNKSKRASSPLTTVGFSSKDLKF